MEELGWKVVTVKGKSLRLRIFIRKLGILGAIGKIQRVEWPIPWEEIERVLKENRVWMCKVEPDITIKNDKLQITNIISQLNDHGFRQDKWPLSASKTIRLSLSGNLSDIQKQMKKDARNILRKRQETSNMNQIKIEKNKFEEFYECWRRGAKIKKLWIPSKKKFMKMIEIFGEDCFCLTAINQNGETTAGVFILIADKTAYYYYSTSLPEGKAVNAPYLLVWEAIKETKRRGCKGWDFEGIYDERWPDKSWKGFSHFKKSFGGVEISFLGSFIKWRMPM